MENPTMAFQMTYITSRASVSLAKASHVVYSKEFSLAQKEIWPFPSTFGQGVFV